MKRPLIPVALCYVGGLLLAEAVQPPLVFLFATSFTLLFVTLLSSRARTFFLWPLLVLIGWTNLVQHTALLSPNDLRAIVGDEPAIVTLRGTLAETPSLRIHERAGETLSRTLAPLRVTALSRDNGTAWQPVAGRVMVSSKGELAPEFFAGREVEITGVIARPAQPIANGLFDYRNYLERKGVYYQLKADAAGDWRAIDSDVKPPFSKRFLGWAKRTLAYGLPEQDEPLRLLWAMTLGWKTALNGEVNEPFMKSGTIVDFLSHTTHLYPRENSVFVHSLVNKSARERVQRFGTQAAELRCRMVPRKWLHPIQTSVHRGGGKRLQSQAS